MPGLKTVGVKDLKNNLSAHLRDVRRGTRILVTDRQQIVAELAEPGSLAVATMHPTLAAWVESGAVRLPVVKKTRIGRSPVSAPEGTAGRLLDEDRRDAGE
jgi:antitoxin (DNA-binding transcriptional repressor) of toxin-antitoxin stability system